jgi:putative tryptophan/tyrosine transport system substrate-binding protein
VSYFTLRWWRNVAVERPPPMIMRAVTGSSDNRIRFQSAMCPGRMYLACTWPLSDLAVTDCNDDGIAEWCFLVRRQVILIAANTPATPVAKAATTTIPIVFLTADDPVAAGLVASLNRPEGNLTGATLLNVEIGPKRLELLHETVPAASVVALLLNPTNPNSERQSSNMQAAARSLGLQLHVLHASTERDFDRAFATLVQLRAGALIIGADAFFINQSEQLGALALRHAVPAISFYRDFVAAGGLIGYGGDLIDAVRLVGVYSGRILKGEKPADLPVQQETKFALTINLKTANTLGIAVPDKMLVAADEVIE